MKNNSVNVTSQTRNQLFVDFTVLPIFIWGNKFDRANLANASGGEVTYPVGTLLAKNATGGLIVYKSSGVGVEQLVVGILAESITLADATNADVNYCIAGDVAAEEIVLDGSDTLATIVGERTISDRLQSDTYGIKAVESDNLTEHDNS